MKAGIGIYRLEVAVRGYIYRRCEGSRDLHQAVFKGGIGGEMKRIDRLGAIAVVALSALGVMAKSPISLERMLTGALFSSISANRALAKTTDGSTDGSDEIQVELVFPPVLLVPEKDSSSATPVKLSLNITNNTSAPIRLARFDPFFMLTLEMREKSGRVLGHKGAKGIPLNTERIDCPFAMPSETVTFFLEGELVWKENKLVLGGQDSLGGSWYFDDVRPGTYIVRAHYNGGRPIAMCEDPETGIADLTEGMWTGEATSPFVEFQVGEMLTGALVSSLSANRALAEPTDNSTDGRDDIYVEILESYVVLPIYQRYGSLSGISLDLAVTNQGQTPIEIAGSDLVPQLVAADGTVVKVQEDKEPSDWCYLLAPGKVQVLFADLDLFRSPNNRQLDLGVENGRTRWDFESITPGTYRLSYVYSQSQTSASDCLQAATNKREFQENARQPPVDSIELRIVESRNIDSNTVEIDGIRFEILMPERVLRIPENEPDASTKVEVGIRITNQTQSPLRFSRFDTLYLSIIGENGQIPESQRLRNRTIPRHPTDLPLVRPGKSATFFMDAKLFWEQNKLRLGGSDGFGGYWYIDSLEPGSYFLGMGYFSPKWESVYNKQRQRLVMTDFWRGSGWTPLVEVFLVKP